MITITQFQQIKGCPQYPTSGQLEILLFSIRSENIFKGGDDGGGVLDEDNGELFLILSSAGEIIPKFF